MATDLGEKDPDLLRYYLDDVTRHLLGRADEQRPGRSIHDGRAAAEELRRHPPESGRRRALEGLVEEGDRSREPLCGPISAWWCRWPSATRGRVLRCWT